MWEFLGNHGKNDLFIKFQTDKGFNFTYSFYLKKNNCDGQSGEQKQNNFMTLLNYDI